MCPCVCLVTTVRMPGKQMHTFSEPYTLTTSIHLHRANPPDNNTVSSSKKAHVAFPPQKSILLHPSPGRKLMGEGTPRTHREENVRKCRYSTQNSRHSSTYYSSTFGRVVFPPPTPQRSANTTRHQRTPQTPPLFPFPRPH